MLLKTEDNIIIPSQTKWRDIFNSTTMNWEDNYNNIFKATIDSVLRNFQYKFLFRIIPTNKLLLKQKLACSNLCDFCSRNVESIEHLFWECSHVQEFWKNVKDYLKQNNINEDINYLNIVFLKFNKGPNESALKCTILTAKYYIYLNKCNERIPNIDGFLKYLTEKMKVEEFIANSKNKIHIHRQKWFNFL
jgi:hypothetical protein